MPSSLFLAFIHAPFVQKLSASVVIAGLLLFPASLAHGADSANAAIKVDQVGYPLDGPKVALVSTPAETFQVRRANDGIVVFQGKLAQAQADSLTGDQVQAADFSSFHKAGSYYLEIPGVGRSWNFTCLLYTSPLIETSFRPSVGGTTILPSIATPSTVSAI